MQILFGAPPIHRRKRKGMAAVRAAVFSNLDSSFPQKHNETKIALGKARKAQ
ncbi:MAG: hypothetical protein GX093_09675 [Xanthomonadaceae bacterium]|nr:hypothetical protein [Xanthomonadaceae bacterium]